MATLCRAMTHVKWMVCSLMQRTFSSVISRLL